MQEIPGFKMFPQRFSKILLEIFFTFSYYLLCCKLETLQNGLHDQVKYINDLHILHQRTDKVS